jgi:hypothetical protein
MFPRKPSLIFLAALALFVAPAVVGLVSYPAYYEDESWVYLAPFEALRGNGFSWAGFHEGSSAMGTFNALVFTLVRISPFSAEVTVRAISLLFGLLCLAAVLVLARRVAKRNSEVAVVLLVFTQIWFLWVRYGRTDVVALAFAMWALVAAASSYLFWAGLLSGIAVSIHPVFVWLAPVCAILALRRNGWRALSSYVIGGLVGTAPQAVWVSAHLRDVQAISSRYMITSSVGHGLTGVASSLANEWKRYTAYAVLLGPLELAAQAVAFLALPAAAIWRAARGERLVLAAMAVVPLLGLALLVQGKNPLYFIYVLPCLAVVAATATRNMPATAVKAACVVALCWSGVRYLRAEQEALRMPDTGQFVEECARRLPANAVVFSPLTYGGLVHRRPDLQFFTYHALAEQPGWRLPPCDRIPGTIQSLVENDPRSTSSHLNRHPEAVFFVKWPDEELLAYLRSIYTSATAADMACIVGNGTPEHVRICGPGPANCREVEIVRRSLQRLQ